MNQEAWDNLDAEEVEDYAMHLSAVMGLSEE